MSDDPESAKAGDLDLSTRRDRTLLLNALTRQWKLPAEVFERAPKILLAELDNPDNKSRDIARIIKLLKELEDSNYQKARDAEERNRLDNGDATENITITVQRTNQIDKPDD